MVSGSVVWGGARPSERVPAGERVPGCVVMILWGPVSCILDVKPERTLRRSSA